MCISKISKVPTNFLDIDFETRSEENIFTAGAAKYAKHPSTQILMISFSINGKDVYNWNPFFPSKKTKQLLENAVQKVTVGKAVIRAHHSEFEYWIWNEVAVHQLGLPRLSVDNFYDTMVLSCAAGFPASLENSGLALNLDQKKEAKLGKQLISFFCSPIRKNDSKWNEPKDHPEKFKEFIEYCNQDVRTQIAIANACPPMDLRQYRTFLLTEQMNIRGLPIDKNMVLGAIELVEQYKANAAQKISKITKGQLTSPTQHKVKDWLNDNACDIPNLQASTIEKYLQLDLPNKTKEVLLLRSHASKSSTAKYVSALGYITDELKVHGFIKAYIAQTGRWGGRGIQIQNFSKPHKDFPGWCDYDVLAELIADKDSAFIELLYGNVMESLKAATRAMISAPKGKKFVSADYSQIEARIVLWMANDKVGLNDFSGDGKIYERMAATIFGINPNDIKKPSFERDVGKETVLGCGFGMGAAKFLHTCVEVRNLPVGKNTAQKAVHEYRKRYKMVPQAWKDCEKCALSAVNNPRKKYSACGGKIEYCYDGKHLTAKLPSGRKIAYPFVKVSVELNDWGYEQSVIYFKKWNDQARVGQKWQYVRTWGGTLFQHAVQGTAADIMADGMINAEKNGYPVLFTVHDESVSIVNKNFGSYEEYERLLCELQPWAKGIPVVAEGWEGTRYKK